MGGDAQDVNGLGLDRYHEQDVHAPEYHGAGLQDVTHEFADFARMGGRPAALG
jgi:hypothetical protein